MTSTAPPMRTMMSSTMTADRKEPMTVSGTREEVPTTDKP
eukprot:CAMPEP_0185515614 /NCGR_PEP_ID=MMETSP1366-20130426/63158_1 /TAXON_ID=38817 /ORGANISM="Gephyrocapsa oceanica, Strain RCC1303" /LENGTH=39 /DNA_ID= /DNA_START= /DNA_END= /DNA_ORIENTATION=